MHVKRVTLDDLLDTYCCMQEENVDEKWLEGLYKAREWFTVNLGKYVEGYHLCDNDKTVGLIYYAMSENALIPYKIEKNIACIYCTEILPNYSHKGYGRMLFGFMIKDLLKENCKGIFVAATEFKEWMYYEHFQKQGFKEITIKSPYRLMYFPLLQEDISVKIVDLKYKPSKDKVEVILFKNFFCPVSVYMYQMIKEIAQNLGDKVKLVEIEANPETIRKYGTADPIINGKRKFYGPSSEEEVKKAIQEEIEIFNK